MPRACDKASRYPGVAFHHARNNSKYKDAEFLKVGQYRIRKLMPREIDEFQKFMDWRLDGIEPPQNEHVSDRCRRKPKGL